MSGSWNGPNCANDNLNCENWQTAGNASWPQFEARFNVGGKMGDRGTWSTYVVGHYDVKDLSGAGFSGCNPIPPATASPCGPGDSDKLIGSAVEIGAKFQIGPVLIQGNGYDGLGIGQQFAAITQFGKIRSTGGWAQLGFDITKNWGIFGFWSIDDPKNSDVAAWVSPTAGRMKNMQYAGMLRWKSGPMAFGFEYIYDKLTVGLQETKRHSDAARAVGPLQLLGYGGGCRAAPALRFLQSRPARTCSRMPATRAGLRPPSRRPRSS